MAEQQPKDQPPKPTRNDSWGGNGGWDAVPAAAAASADTSAAAAAPGKSPEAVLSPGTEASNAVDKLKLDRAAAPASATAASPSAPKLSEDWAAVGAAEVAAAVEKLNVEGNSAASAPASSSASAAEIKAAPAPVAPRYNFKELIPVDGAQIQITSATISHEHLRGEKQWKDIDAIVENVEPQWDRKGVWATIKKNVTLTMGWPSPSRIQSIALPMLLEKASMYTNLLYQSQAGTGKTAAFAIAALTACDPKSKFAQALIIAPTQEIVEGHVGVISALGKDTGVVVQGYFGLGKRDELASVNWADPKHGLSRTQIETREAITAVDNHKPITQQIIIGTPGKIKNFVVKKSRNTKFPPKIDARNIRLVVIDEADDLLNGGGDARAGVEGRNDVNEIITAIEKAHQKARTKFQTVLCSATYKPEFASFVDRVIGQGANRIELPRADVSVANIKQYYIVANTDREKIEILNELFLDIEAQQIVIFCERKDACDQLCRKLTEEGFATGLLHGTISKIERTTTLNKFKDGKYKILVTTKVMARGVDLPNCTIVVNYTAPVKQKSLNARAGDHGSPADLEQYIHRIGRCGRFGKTGLAFTMIEDNPDQYRILKEIGDYWNRPIEKLDPNDDSKVDEANEHAKKQLTTT